MTVAVGGTRIASHKCVVHLGIQSSHDSCTEAAIVASATRTLASVDRGEVVKYDDLCKQ